MKVTSTNKPGEEDNKIKEEIREGLVRITNQIMKILNTNLDTKVEAATRITKKYITKIKEAGSKENRMYQLKEELKPIS